MSIIDEENEFDGVDKHEEVRKFYIKVRHA